MYVSHAKIIINVMCFIKLYSSGLTFTILYPKFKFMVFENVFSTLFSTAFFISRTELLNRLIKIEFINF